MMLAKAFAGITIYNNYSVNKVWVQSITQICLTMKSLYKAHTSGKVKTILVYVGAYA